MGRQANRKWVKRVRKYRKASVTEKLRIQALFGRKRQFQA